MIEIRVITNQKGMYCVLSQFALICSPAIIGSNKTRQGYAACSTLKLAGYFFAGYGNAVQ